MGLVDCKTAVPRTIHEIHEHTDQSLSLSAACLGRDGHANILSHTIALAFVHMPLGGDANLLGRLAQGPLLGMDMGFV